MLPIGNKLWLFSSYWFVKVNTLLNSILDLNDLVVFIYEFKMAPQNYYLKNCECLMSKITYEPLYVCKI